VFTHVVGKQMVVKKKFNKSHIIIMMWVSIFSTHLNYTYYIVANELSQTLFILQNANFPQHSCEQFCTTTTHLISAMQHVKNIGIVLTDFWKNLFLSSVKNPPAEFDNDSSFHESVSSGEL
jgi:hypothetical protein